MSSSSSEADQTIRRLVEALQGYGYDTDSKSGRMDLSIHSGVSVASLNELFDLKALNNQALVSLCRLIGFPLEELLKSDEPQTRVVSIFPYEGGTPIRLLIPADSGLSIEEPSLFYLQVSAGDNLPPSFLIGTRACGAPTIGETYIVEDDASIEIMSCTATQSDGSAVLAAVGEPDRRAHLSPPSRLKLVVGDDAVPEPVITGRVLWQMNSLSRPGP